MTLAGRVDIQLRDLDSSGWQSIPPQPYDALIQNSCPGFEHDYSRFTITGRHHRRFVDRETRGEVDTDIEVFETAAEAAGDFTATAQPGLLTCVRQYVSDPGVAINSAGLSRGASSHERTAQYRLGVQVSSSNGTLEVHVDFLLVQVGRDLAMVMVAGQSEGVLSKAEAGVMRKLRSGT